MNVPIADVKTMLQLSETMQSNSNNADTLKTKSKTGEFSELLQVFFKAMRSDSSQSGNSIKVGRTLNSLKTSSSQLEAIVNLKGRTLENRLRDCDIEVADSTIKAASLNITQLMFLLFKFSEGDTDFRTSFEGLESKVDFSALLQQLKSNLDEGNQSTSQIKLVLQTENKENKAVDISIPSALLQEKGKGEELRPTDMLGAALDIRDQSDYENFKAQIIQRLVQMLNNKSTDTAKVELQEDIPKDISQEEKVLLSITKQQDKSFFKTQRNSPIKNLSQENVVAAEENLSQQNVVIAEGNLSQENAALAQENLQQKNIVSVEESLYQQKSVPVEEGLPQENIVSVQEEIKGNEKKLNSEIGAVIVNKSRAGAIQKHSMSSGIQESIRGEEEIEESKYLEQHHNIRYLRNHKEVITGVSRSSTKDEKVLDELTSKNDRTNLSKVNLLINDLNNALSYTNKAEALNVKFINENTFAADVIKAVKYMEKSSIKELTVKIAPKELGEVVIRLTMEAGLLKANITANNKDAYSILNAHLQDIRTGLEVDIKIQNVSINIYQGDTTFFKEGSKQQEERGDRRREKGLKSLSSKEVAINTELDITDEGNINILA